MAHGNNDTRLRRERPVSCRDSNDPMQTDAALDQDPCGCRSDGPAQCESGGRIRTRVTTGGAI